MIKQVVVSNGKRYIVNAPGWNDDVGPGASVGTMWMKDTADNLWYAVTLTGSPAAAFFVDPTPISPVVNGFTNDLGYQLLQSTNGNVYQILLTGGAVVVNPVPWINPLDYKSNLFLMSQTDLFGYPVVLQGLALVIDTAHSSSIRY